MGADTFMDAAYGKNVSDAFGAAHERALYDYGHRGYTGSLAEKHDFVVIPFAGELSKEGAQAQARQLMDAYDARIDDKWGPAGAIRFTDEACPADQEAWLFFGWASS